MYNITTVKNIFQYQTAKFNNIKKKKKNAITFAPT